MDSKADELEMKIQETLKDFENQRKERGKITSREGGGSEEATRA